MPESASLRVYGNGQIEVELATAFLIDLKHAYDSILVFESTIYSTRRAIREFPSAPWPLEPAFGWPLTARRNTRYFLDWPPTAKQIASAVPRAEQLVLQAVNLSSPGFWEFLGTLNPLEVARQYINDRHKRRQDREYRESAESRRLVLENLSLENKVLAERIKIAKDLGATDRDLAPLLNELVNRPLMALDRYQDAQMIENAEILSTIDRSEIHNMTRYDT